MKDKIPCELIRDLMPSYIDELTSDVTNEWVEDHVADCNDCKTVLDAMREPGAEPATDVDEKEIDFLKKARKRTRRIVVGSVVIAFLIFMALMFTSTFVIGDAIGSESVYCRAEVDKNVLTIEATMVDSARVPSGVRFEEEEPGIVNVSYKAVLTSPWNNMGTMVSEYTSKSEITQVKVDDRIIWAKGTDILEVTSAVYATRHPYVGDMPANALSIAALNMVSYLGGFSNELQTSKEPYGWTFVLDEEISAERVALKENMMKSYAYVFLAAVENLGEVTYEFAVEGEESKLMVTAEEASDFVGHDIKDCYEDIVLLQNLIRKTGLDAYAFMDTDEIEAAMIMSAAADADAHRQAAEEQAKMAAEMKKQAEETSALIDGEFQIKIVNNADDNILMMGLSYGLDGDWIGTQSGGYAAENTAIRRGDSMTFMFYPQDFGLSDWGKDVFAEFEAEVEDMESNNYPVEPSFCVPVKGGKIYTYILSGNAKDGYVIEQ